MQISNPVKKYSYNSINKNQILPNKIPTVKSVSDLTQGQVNNYKNMIFQNPNTNQNNMLNTSTSLSVQESQSSLQNQNQNFILTPNAGNFPPKEYFNFPFFKRQMSSRSSDVDFGADNKEGLNDFLAARFNSVLSKDSSVPQSNIIKQSVDRSSCDFNICIENLSTNLENKDEQSQVFLTRANSACLNKCSNYIPKTFYFQRHNSNTQSCFLKKNNIGNNTNNNSNSNFNNNNNLLLRYYGNNNEYGNSLNKNKFLDVVNDKDDDDEDDDEDDDGCMLTSKDNEEFSLNYLSRKSTQNLTLPKTTLTLVHRNSSNFLNNPKSQLTLEKSPEAEDEKLDKKKLPPVKTNTLSYSTKKNIYKDIEEKEDDDKNNEDSEFMDESKSNIDNEEKNENENNKDKKDNSDEEKSDNNDTEEVPSINNLKTKKSNKSHSNDQDIDNQNNEIQNNNIKNNNSQNMDENNFFLKKSDLSQNQAQSQMQIQNKIPNNLNLLDMQNIPEQNNNNLIQYQLSQNQNQNIYQQNYNSLPLMIGNMNQHSNNYPIINEEQMLQEMQNLKINNNNNYMNNFNIMKSQPNFRNNNYPTPQMMGDTDDLLKNVTNYIKDQAGCRFIQKKIDENPQISNNLFELLYQDLLQMCRDLFGNYVVQKILENINSKCLVKFIELISKDFLNLAISTYGTRVIQKILEIVSTKSNKSNSENDIYEQCFILVNNHITNNIVELSSNNNSSHIIIKYVKEIRYPKNVQLFNEVYKNFIALCKDKHGCCVIQKCIDLGSPEQKNKLLELSNINCSNLISDQFGNYVIQFVVSLNLKIVNSKVCEVLKNNLCSLCKEKYASNVIEKFLANKSEESQEIINMLLKDEKILHELIIDQFGNYIIQRILVLVEGENRSLLIRYIVQWYPEIKSLPFGPRLISKLHERYQEFTLLVTQNYGWDTTQETVSYLHLNGQKFNNNFNKNNLNNNMNNMNNLNNMFDRNMNNNNNNNDYSKRNPSFQDMLRNFNNNNIMNRTNNNCMNFKNKSNVGNINFIQMNNYMLSPGMNGQNNQRFKLNNSQLFSNYNNMNDLNNNQLMNELNAMNSNMNNNLFFQRNQQQNYFKDPNNNLIQNLNSLSQNNNGNNLPFNMQFNNMGNNNQNLLNYQQYLNMAFPNMQK